MEYVVSLGWKKTFFTSNEKTFKFIKKKSSIANMFVYDLFNI